MNLKMQTLATCNNYYCTGQYNKALNLLNQLKKIFPDDKIASDMIGEIVVDSIKQTGFSLIGESRNLKDFSELFGINWQGENLENKSITIFCDQGMGDVLNMLRYIEVIKNKWNCIVYLNCYAFFDEFKDFFKHVKFIDFFTKDYEKTDYHTNIFSLASILNGINYQFHYPAHFRDLLETDIPKQVLSFPDVLPKSIGPKIGLAWKSNSNNPLAENKSIDLSLFKECGREFCSLIPEETNVSFLVNSQIKTVLDTVSLIKGLDLVISVDTMVLHLAGLLGKKTIGLLGKDSDPRWGDDTNTVWYESIDLYRCNGDWGQLIEVIKKEVF